jgi:phosphoribosylanthranilate isomerase
MLSTLVKISAVTHLSDARYCAGMGVEMLGFCIDEGDENYVSPKKFTELKGWISGVQLVAETQQKDPELIKTLLTDYEVDLLQVNDPTLLAVLDTELPLLLQIDCDAHTYDSLRDVVASADGLADYFLLESSTDQALSEEWLTYIERLSVDYPILVGFGLTDPEFVVELLDQLPIEGIALRGSQELRPGYKDYGSLMDILEALEEE